jgi:HSP20 family protein
MKNKILISIVIILAAAFIFENAYLLGSRHSLEGPPRITRTQYRPLAVERFPVNSPPAFRQVYIWDPFEEMDRMHERMEQAFRNSFPGMLNQENIFSNNTFVESGINFSDAGSAYIVKVSLPKVEKDAINIQVKGRQLTISNYDKQKKSKVDKNYYSKRSSYDQFVSSFMFPQDAGMEQLKSDYKNGILTITVPKEKTDRSTNKSAVKIPVK